MSVYLSLAPAMALKPKNVRLYLNEENQQMLRELASSALDFSESQLLTLLVTASLRTLKAQGYRFTIPLKLAVVEDVELPTPSRRL